MAKISVIVAVYKMEQFLPRCIDGILGQTFRDLELILVDDGSPDGCGEICDGYALRDKRVRVIHKKNAGVCAARNTGLDWVCGHSDSQWIFFHDNDDWIHPETLARLLDAAERMNTKIAICGYQETSGDNPVIREETLEPVLWRPEDFYRERFVNATVCWGKLYHRSCFEGLRYPPGKYIEDEFVTYRILFAQEQLAVIDAPLYAYYVNLAGLSKKTWQPKRLDAWEAYDQQIAFFQERGMEDMVRFRLRGFLDNALHWLEAAETAPNAPELKKTIRFMKRRIRRLLVQCWQADCLEFWPDSEVLLRFYPVAARFYRLWLEIRQKLRRRKRNA